MLVILLLVASAAKIIPVTLISKLCTRKSWHYCSSLGVLMNTRGIVQLVVLNIGVELNVISNTIFAMFVLMATILTFLTTPLLYLLYRKHIDPKKLAMDDIAEELNFVREENIHLKDIPEDIETISNGDLGLNEERRSSTKLPRQVSTNSTGQTVFLSVEERINYPEIDPAISGFQPVVIGNIVTMPTCPKRLINMTRF
jgi:hypothetical protein